MKYIFLVAATTVVAAIFIPTALAASPAGLHIGSSGSAVTELQQLLHMNSRADFYTGTVDGDFGPVTKAGLEKWQTADGYQPTGSITAGGRQWNQLKHEATVERLTAYISQSAITAARQTGWAVDASKSPSVVTVLHRNQASGLVTVTLSISAAFAGNIGGVQYTTYDGVFHIYADYGPNFVSREYNNAPMPYAACFNGGQCLHEDGLFPSHGCIHIPSYPAAEYINRLPLGTTVVVHG